MKVGAGRNSGILEESLMHNLNFRRLLSCCFLPVACYIMMSFLGMTEVTGGENSVPKFSKFKAR